VKDKWITLAVLHGPPSFQRVQNSILKLCTVPAEVYLLTSHSHESDLFLKMNLYFVIRQLLFKKMHLDGYYFFLVCLSGVGKNDQDGSE